MKYRNEWLKINILTYFPAKSLLHLSFPTPPFTKSNRFCAYEVPGSKYIFVFYFWYKWSALQLVGVLFNFIHLISFCFIVIFLLNNSIIHLLSFFIRNCGIHTNRKWNDKHVSVLHFIFVSCSLTIEEVGCHSLPLK